MRYLKFFLDVAPTEPDRAKVPSDSRDVIIAKVLNLMQPPAYLIGRDSLSSTLPKDLFFTRIQIVDVLSGSAQVGAQYDVYFGIPGLGGPQQIYPHTPRQNAREYFVVSYVGADDKRRLLPFPANEQEYNSWSQEVSEHERVRSRPGHRDQRLWNGRRAMDWVDLEAKIKIWGPDGTPSMINGHAVSGYGTAFTATQKATILAALQDLYDHSPTARALLEAGAAVSDIWLVNRTGAGSSAAIINSRTAGIDLTQATTFRWMGRDGQFQLENLAGNIIHELIHAIDGTRDLVDPVTGLPSATWNYNHPDFDHLGLTVRKQNQIFQEMGWGEAYWQVGYDATFNVNPSILRTDISYTEGQTIDIAYFDNARNQTPNVLNLSYRTDSSRDLIIGLSGDDRINGGAGRDYLYGGTGDDAISGGSGDDVIHGGDRKTAIGADGKDTADYSYGDRNEMPPSGITVQLSVSGAGAALEGVKPVMVTDDGYGNIDRLYSIEKIIGTDRPDRVFLLEEAALKLDLTIDLGDSGYSAETPFNLDVYDLSLFPGGLTYDDGRIRLGSRPYENLVVKNADKVILTSQNDVFKRAASATTVYT